MFRKITEQLFASPQIDVDAVSQAHAQGIVKIINNRPEGEGPDQIPGSEIEAAARALGMEYVAIPITHAGFSQAQVDAMITALDTEGPILAYCRSGTRSTLLWALAAAKSGMDPQEIAASAAQAGYDTSPVRSLMDVLASAKN